MKCKTWASLRDMIPVNLTLKALAAVEIVSASAVHLNAVSLLSEFFQFWVLSAPLLRHFKKTRLIYLKKLFTGLTLVFIAFSLSFGYLLCAKNLIKITQVTLDQLLPSVHFILSFSYSTSLLELSWLFLAQLTLLVEYFLKEQFNFPLTESLSQMYKVLLVNYLLISKQNIKLNWHKLKVSIPHLLIKVTLYMPH